MAADASGRRELLARLLDESTDALFALDGNGAILFANAAAAALVAQERSYLLGKPFPALVAFDDRRDFRRLVSSLTAQEPCRSMTIRLTSDGTSWSVAVRRLGREGGPFAVRIVDSKAAADIANERLVGIEVERTLLRLPQAVLGVAADGTVAFANERARRLLGEAQLRRGRPLPDESHGVPLGLLVDRLLGGPSPMPPQLLELSNGRSVRVTGTGARGGAPAVLVFDDISQHIAHATAERLFVQNAAHQLRTPLAGITNAVELLQAGAKEDPVARDRFLAHLERETHRLTRLARALLVLARAQAGVQPPRLDFVEVEPVLRRITDRLEVRRGVTVHVSCAANVAAFAEPDLLEEALAALAENAARYTTRGTITLRAAREDGALDIEIEDSGAGILPEHQELLFDPFFRGTADGDGFGLGLAIAAQAVAALGATLTVESAPHRGSRFSFRLPAAEVVTA